MLLPPVQQRLDEAYKMEMIWGDFANDSGSTGGEMDFECDNVLFCDAVDESASAAVIRVQRDTSVAGKCTITTTADHSGRFLALVSHRR